MRNGMVSLRSSLLAIVYMLAFAASQVSADEVELAERSLSALPSSVLGVFVLHNAEQCEQALKRPVEQFGGSALPVGTFLGNLPGTNPKGLLVLGLAE